LANTNQSQGGRGSASSPCAGKLLPVEPNSLQFDATESSAAEPVAYLERLPEVLFDSLKAELAESEVVELVIVVLSGILSCRVQRFAGCQRPIDQQHRVIVNRIHGRQNSEKNPARPQAETDLPEHVLLFGYIGHDDAVNGCGHIKTI